MLCLAGYSRAIQSWEEYIISAILRSDRCSPWRQTLEAKKKRFTLDLDLVFQRRVKVIAALKGTSMRLLPPRAESWEQVMDMVLQEKEAWEKTS